MKIHFFSLFFSYFNDKKTLFLSLSLSLKHFLLSFIEKKNYRHTYNSKQMICIAFDVDETGRVSSIH